MKMEMDAARYGPMDAQRFDPLLRTSTKPNSLSKTGTSKLTMGQGLCVRTRPCMLFPGRASVGGIWPNHEVVVVPLDGGDADSEVSRSSTPISTSSTSTSSTTTTETHEPPATSDVPSSHAPQVDVNDRDDVVITRTIIRPNPNPNPHPNPSRMPSRTQMTLARMFSRSQSPTASPSSLSSALPHSNPPSRPTSPVLQALNCFSTSSAFERDEDDMQMRGGESPRPVFQVIVTQTRERYEDDRAFKEIVGSVYPGPVAAAVGGGA